MVQIVLADSDFQPIVGPLGVTPSSPSPQTVSLPPSALPLIQSRPRYSAKDRHGMQSSHEDNIFMESKRYAPTVVRYTKRRDPPVPAPKRPIKRHHAHTYSRPRRRPKPVYGPPGYTYGAPLNDFSLAGDIYDPSMYSLPTAKKPNSEKGPSTGVVDTDIGKFYDSSPGFNTNSFKASYKPFGTSLLSPTSLFGGTNDYKLGEPNPILTNSDSSPSGTYPPSSSNFDVSNFNLYEPNPQTIYATAPQQTQQNLLSTQIQSQLSLSSIPQLMGTFGDRQPPSKKNPLPPSTSYGVPIAPILSSYAIDSSRNSYQIPLQNPAKGVPTGPSDASNIPSDIVSQSSYLPNSGTNLQGISNLAGSNRAPQGHFAEPPQNVQQLNQPIQNQYETAISSYDAPYQFKQTFNSGPGRVQSISTQQNVNANEVPDYEDDQLESSTNTDNFAQPVLPNSYDQEEFEAFAKQKRKLLLQQQKDFKRFEEFTSFFDKTEESLRIPTKPKRKPQATAETDDFDDAPDDDYLDEIVGRPTTKRPTRFRKKKTRTTASPHVLDTDDLRDAFSSGSVKYSMAVKPDDMGPPVQTIRQKKKSPKPSRAQVADQQQQPQQTNNKKKAKIRPLQQPKNNANQFDIISIQQSLSPSSYDGNVNHPNWNAGTSNSKQNGIQNRYDSQNFGIGDAIGRPEVRPPKITNHNYNVNHDIGKHKYESTDRLDTFDQAEDQEDDAIGTVEEQSSVKIPTSPATKGTTLWDGKTMPKNHKMA